MSQQIKTAIHKMQRNAVNVEEDLATYVDGLAGLWIPPADDTQLIRWIPAHNSDLRVGEACRILGIPDVDITDREKVKSIYYSLTEQLEKDLCSGKDPDILTDGSEGFQHSLSSKGWKYKRPNGTEQKRLLREFLNLSGVPPEELGSLVRRFVLRWGPLWCCMEHMDCFWAPTSYSSNWYSWQHGCRWFYSEPAILFQARARQAEAAITIVGYLAEDKHAPIEYWRTLTSGLGLGTVTNFGNGHEANLAGRTKYDLWVQQRRLMEEINRFLASPNGPSFRMLWSDRQRKPVMSFDMGLGFFRLVWLQIAQGLCGGRGIYRCDSCPNYYIPDRKPPEGRHHFCPACGGDRKLGSKKLSARARRNRQNTLVKG